MNVKKGGGNGVTWAREVMVWVRPEMLLKFLEETQTIAINKRAVTFIR